MSKKPVIAAAIDLGSNSFRLLIGFIAEHEPICLLKERATVRLASNLDKNGVFSSEGIAQALTAVKAFRSKIDRLGVNVLRCCGTEALRRSTNPQDLTIPAAKILGAPIEILRGKEEAELTCLGVTNALGKRLSFPCLMADVGGGSTELILLRSLECKPVVLSLPIGAVVFSGRDQILRTQDLYKFSGCLREFIQTADLPSPPVLVGTGGTAGALAALAQELPTHDPAKIHGFFLPSLQIGEIYDSLAALSINDRKTLKGLEPGREEIIMPGLEIYQEILATIGCEGMMVSGAGLLEGILLSITGAQRF